MPTSEINRLLKRIEIIAKENDENYFSAEIRATHNHYDKIKINKEYRAYIPEIAPWISGNSFENLIENVKTNIKKLKDEKNT